MMTYKHQLFDLNPILLDSETVENWEQPSNRYLRGTSSRD